MTTKSCGVLVALVILTTSSTLLPTLAMNLLEPLHEAVYEGNLEDVQDALYQVPNIDLPSTEGTPLVRAVRYGHPDIAYFLVNEYGADVNATDDEGWTALMWAANNGDAALVAFLLYKNAELDMQTNEGFTAQEIARELGYEDIVRIIERVRAMDAEAEMNSSDSESEGEQEDPIPWRS